MENSIAVGREAQQTDSMECKNKQKNPNQNIFVFKKLVSWTHMIDYWNVFNCIILMH